MPLEKKRPLLKRKAALPRWQRGVSAAVVTMAIYNKRLHIAVYRGVVCDVGGVGWCGAYKR